MQGKIAALLATRDRADWAEQLDVAGIPWGPVNSLSEVTADPHFRARGLFREVADGNGERRHHVAQPLIFSGEHPGPRSGVPRLGEHTEQVLCALPELKD